VSADAILYPEWSNEQENSTYPFSDIATMSSKTTALPKSLFVDAKLYPIGGGYGQYLSLISIGKNSVTVKISDDSGELCSGTYDRESDSKSIQLFDSYGRSAGVLVGLPGSIKLLFSWPEGDYPFKAEQTAFTATVIVPTPEVGVRGIMLPDGTLMTGDVWLVGEQGVRIYPEDGAIRVDVVGDPTARNRFYGEDLASKNTPYLITINGRPSNQCGDFKIVSTGGRAIDTVLRVLPESNGISLSFTGLGGGRG
jgi:hypothetical protein